MSKIWPIYQHGFVCGARPRIAVSLLLASLALPCCAEPAPVIHYAPEENLEHVDVALIDRAEREIDMAAYVLTDWPVMQALTGAADRGVHIRIYLDGTQFAEREPAKVFHDLAETPGLEIIIKREEEEFDGGLTKHTAAAAIPASSWKVRIMDGERVVFTEEAKSAAICEIGCERRRGRNAS